MGGHRPEAGEAGMSKKNAEGILMGDNSIPRCWWCGDDPLYVKYHDTEWGFPVKDDTRLFEKICLEGFQSGLAWITILRKRENFREAFADFDMEQVAKFGKRDITRLLKNVGIIRHRGKIEASINNAKRAIELATEYQSLASYFWSHEPEKPSRPKHITKDNIPSTTPDSIALSKDLKKRGWKFVGPTTAYAFMQAMGLVNDHVQGCHTGELVKKALEQFKKPGNLEG